MSDAKMSLLVSYIDVTAVGGVLWHQVYSAGSDVLGIEGWLALLSAGALLGRAKHTGIDKHAAKVVFMLSQASVVDKLGSPRSRDEGLKLFDFVEGAQGFLVAQVLLSAEACSCWVWMHP
ncbi:hypothetical protein DUNSADRAFT_8853 [Dunaliella salina]|uniref:Encoded protein n=1 Tax=Dunaliella salina TaxID=3046 RepID=A0ABQ7H5Q3_DUNSA|nr:hypothetical protein DUNSADRAFT_8853 [Dunaliella salina]|eukprot:KAF5842166.1 hypothetical protein DUNSADRAFT_8853 [Dunaliella salina]